MFRRRLLFALIFIAAIGGTARTQEAPQATPFGLRFGMTLEELQKLAGPLTQVGGNNYQLAKVPTPHPALQDYQVEVSPKYGLCTIAATTAAIRPNDFGDQVKTSFSDIAAQVEQRYGPPARSVDQLKPGSIWNDPNDWTMGLVQGERSLAKAWIKPAPGISSLGVMAHPMSRFDVRIAVFYEAANSDACKAEAKAAQSGAF